MAIMRAEDMLVRRPLHGWTGRSFHSATMTFTHWDIAADAVPLYEHHHPQEEVWHVVEGEIALTIAGVEEIVRAGMAAVVPPETSHSATPRGACKAIVADYPLRTHLPGVHPPD
jgi:mannose-6-phosphate isomerase-like protein (cupin superfamily)